MKKKLIILFVSILLISGSALRVGAAFDDTDKEMGDMLSACTGTKTDKWKSLLEQYCNPFVSVCMVGYLDGSGWHPTDGRTKSQQDQCMKGYYDKAMSKVKDEMISSYGIDTDRATSLTDPCGSDISCISSVLTSAKSDTSFGDFMTTTSSEGALTLSDAQSLISSSDQSGSTSNSASSLGATGEALQSKPEVPQVKVSFSSLGSLTDGSKITARAVPSLFKSDSSSLYFTWYIKHKNKQAGLDCELTKDGDKLDETNKNCDLDGDGKITVNDWKIAASRIIVQGDFDKSTADYSADVSAKKTDVPYPTMKQWAIDSRSDDGSLRSKNDATTPDSDIPNCYFEDPKSGTIYELRNTNSVFLENQNPCASGYHPACVADQTASCNVKIDTSANAINPQNTFNACQIAKNATNDVAGEKSLYSCDADESNLKANAVCNDKSQTALCVPDLGGDFNFPSSATDPSDTTNPLYGTIFNMGTDLVNNTDNVCSKLAKPNSSNLTTDPPFLNNANLFRDPSGNFIHQTCQTVTNWMINGIYDRNKKIVKSGNPSLKPTGCSFEKQENVCKHLFPYFPGSKDESSSIPIVIYDKNSKKFVNTEVNMSKETTGDGKFTKEEMEFWGTNPTTDSTNGSGTKDESVIMGLGVDKFSWTYTTGDEVGVAVEGESELNTDHTDSSRRIMWAFSKNSCDKFKKENTGFYTETTPGGSSVGIRTVNFDLDNCLEENLITPNLGDAQQFTSPTVSVNATPQNPINDPNGDGDILKASAESSNMSNVFYNWHVFISEDGSNNELTNWTDITDKLVANKSLTSDDLQGLDKTDLSIDLNLPDSIVGSRLSSGSFYLKIKAEVTENTGNKEQNQTTFGQTFVKINEQQNAISLYPVSADISGKLSLIKSISNVSTELSKQECDSTACYVTKNQVIGMQVSDNKQTKLSGFSWSINGSSWNCNSNISSDCSKVGSNTLFLPVLGNVGESVNVIASAKNENTGGLIQVSKHFVIVDKAAQIISADASLAWPKVLGYYRDGSGQPTIADTSDQVYEANTGNNITLISKFYPASSAGQVGYEWTVDGQTVPVDPSKPNELQLSIDKPAGDSYTIGVTATRSADADTQAVYMRTALLKNWGVSLDDTSDINSNASIQINVLDAKTVAQANSKNNFAASLITHLPEQIMFLLKLVLTAFSLLFFAGILFALIPEPMFQDVDNRRY